MATAHASLMYTSARLPDRSFGDYEAGFRLGQPVLSWLRNVV